MSKDYANAPYNFIEFPDRVVYKYDNIDDLPKHDSFRSDLNTGYINYTLKSLTPLFIGSGLGQKDLFFKVKGEDGEETYVIPGSTIKGRIRSNAEALSFSYPQFIEDRKFLYRDIAGETISQEEYYENLDLNGDNVDISDKLQAGYLYKKNNNYYIQPAKKIKFSLEDNKFNEKSFFKIEELKLRLNDVRTKYMYADDLDLIKKIKKVNNNEKYTELKEKYYAKIRKGKDGKRVKSFTYSNFEFKKSYIKFDTNNNGGIGKIHWNYKSNLRYLGYLYNSEWIKGKKSHYVINEPDQSERLIKVPDYLIHQFEKDYKDNKIKNQFYHLPKGKEKKVVFYKVENEELKYLGRTPYLRIFYQNSVKEILNNKMLQKNDVFDKNNKNLKYRIDYAEALFGFTNKEVKIKNKNDEIKAKIISYKGRVNFSDLKKEYGQVLKELPIYDKNSKSKEFILGTPKPTSFQLYLKQDKINNKKLTTYNTPTIKNGEKRIDPELRGQKFYWQRNEVTKIQEAQKNNMKKNLKSIENGKFSGEIYFENLSDDELGLLLLALKYNEGTTDNIGMAKPYGYGKIDIKDIELVIENKKESFEDFFFKENNGSEKSIEEYKNDFKKEFFKEYQNNEEVEIEDYEKLSIVKQYKVSKLTIENKEIERTFEYEYSRGNKRSGIYKVNEFDYMEITRQTGYKNDRKQEIKVNEYKDRKILKDINKYAEDNKNG